MNNKLVFDDSYTFHTKIYCDVFSFMKNVLQPCKDWDVCKDWYIYLIIK